jgi:hypothetical protein
VDIDHGPGVVRDPSKETNMYVVVHHRFIDPTTAFARGEKLIRNDGAPTGVVGLQFYPARDGSEAVCLWEAPSLDSVQQYVDSTLGASSANACFTVDAEQAFADRPLGMQETAAVRP